MLPETLLRYRLAGTQVIPAFLDERDLPWLRELISEYERFIGKPKRMLAERLKEPFSFEKDSWKLKVAGYYLRKVTQTRVMASIRPRVIRKEVFEGFAQGLTPREMVIQRSAEKWNLSSDEMEEALFADLPGERKVMGASRALSPQNLVLQINLLLAQGLLFRSSRVSIQALGNSRALVRHAKFKGLICTVHDRSDGREIELSLSGPYSLFRKTLLYGRALSELLPILQWSKNYRIQAYCVLREKNYRLILDSKAPLPPSQEPREYDSQLEERFAREFRKLAIDWDLIREAEPVSASGTLIFPDFLLKHRRDPSRRWLLEIAGFWTPDYLSKKLERLRDAKIDNLILCVDEERNCSEAEFPSSAKVLFFRRKVDPARVLAIIEKELSF